MTDTEILDWLIEHGCLASGHFMGGETEKMRTASGCGCCTETIENTPHDVIARVRSI